MHTDILIVGGLLLLYVFAQSYEPKPFLSSKLNTATQIVLAALVIASLAFSFEWAAVYVQGLIVATALTTIASGTEYMIEWWRRMNRLEQG